jgi:ABC-type antimicrobial peptide transport system permease subunit
MLGVFRYVVTERVTEIGLRKALGATGRDVVALVLRGIAAPLAAGSAVGLIAAQAFGSLLGQNLYGISPRDPLAYAVVLIVVLLTALLALVGPARRALRVDPASMLRAE